MTDSKYDINKGKELYKTVTSLSNLNRTEDDFLGKLQDQEYAKKVYNTFKDENLLGAKDEQSFLDSLGFNKASQPVETKQPVDKPFDINLADTIPDVNIPKIKPEAPKALQSTAEDFKMEFKERNLLPNPMAIKDITKISDIVSETPAERLQAQINTLGGDAITNMAKAEALSADIDKQLDELNKQYGAFLSEYEIKRNEIIPNVNDPWTPAMPALFGKRKANADYLLENEKLYDEINKKQQALFRQKELINTYKQYAEFGRQLEVGKRMSTLVSDGKITEDTMKILRSDGSQKSKDEYLTRLYNGGKIDKDTLRELYNLGDLTKDNEFLYGTFKTGNWNDILSMGMNEIARDLDITGIVRDIKAGKEVTEEEANTLNLYLKLSEIQDKASGENKEYGWWFNAGLGFQQSLRFIAEMGLSAGVFGAPTAGMKSFGIKGAKALIEKYGTKQATKMIMGKAGQVAAEGAYNTALRIPAMPSMYSNWSDRVLNLEMNKDDVSYWDHLNAVRGAYVDTFTAMFSETLGGVLDDLPLFTMMTKGKASKPLIETLFSSLSKLSNNEIFSQTGDILKNVGITSIPGEIVSELSDNLMNGILNLDSSQLSAFTDWDFYKEVALTSFIMGGAGGAVNYFAGGVGAVVQSKKMQKEYEDAILSLNNTEFGDERMNALKNELLEAMARQQYITTDKSSNERGVADIVMDMNSLYQSSVPQSKDKNAWMTWMKEGNKLSLADRAVRTGAYRYGEQQVIKDYVALNLGVAKDKDGNVIPMDFEHEDGNVYEFTDTQGKNYFILDGTDDTVVLMDRATGEKIVKNKSFTDIGTTTQTNANQWAMNTMLRNTQAWSARGMQASQQVKDDNFIPATSLEIDGIIVPVKSYNPKTDTYTITDGNGNDVEVSRTDAGIVEVDAPTAANGLSQNEVDPELEREIATAGQNLPPIVETPPTEGVNTSAPLEGQTNTTTNTEDEVDTDGFKKDKDGKRIWSSQPTQKSKEFIDNKLGLEQGRKYVKDQIKEAKKALNAVSKNTSTNLDLDERFKELEAIEAQKKAAQDNLDYWTEIDKLYDAPQVNQDTTGEITAETETPVNTETTAPVEPEVETEVNAVPYEQMTSEDAKARIDAEQGENAFSFVDVEQAKAAKALERAEKILSMSNNTTSELRKKYEQDVADRKKDLQFWTDVLNLYPQSNTANPNATTEQTGQVPQDSTSGENIGGNNREDGETSDISDNGDGGSEGETKEGENNNRPIAETSKDLQDELRKAGIKFEEAFDNINGKGNTDWKRWVDSSPESAPLMQAILKKAQEEARANGGYISDDTYNKLNNIIVEATSSDEVAINYLYSAMLGKSNSKSLVDFGKDTYLGQRGIQKGVIYGVDTIERLFNEVPKMDSDIQALANRVFSICKELGIGVIFTNKKFGRNVIGNYTNRNVIRYKASYLNGDATSSKKKALYLHEAIHAVTSYALSKGNYDILPPNMREAVDELKSIYKDLSEKGLLKGWYGGKNVREMVAEMANPLFRSYLKSINAFKDIVNAITKFFVDVEVFGSSNTNAFEQVNNALNKLLDLFNKELYDNYNMSTGLYDISEDGSIDTMYESVGLRYEKGENGETIIRNEDGDIVDEVTEDMINNSPLGASLKDAVKNGIISEEDRKQQLEFFKGLFNLQLRVNDLDLIYAVSGAIGFQPVEPGPRDMSKSDINGKKQPFAAITSNADKQYSTTIDFTTICKKTQAVINNMSTIMVKLGRGLTKEEIVDIVFKNTHKAGEPVPCPVCYVFSRWVGLGGLFDNIKSLQEKYKDADIEQLQKDIDILNEKVDSIAKSRGLDRSKAKDNLMKSIQDELNTIRFKEEKGNELTRKEKALAKMLEEQLFQIDNLTWLTDVRLADGYKPVPDHILFDINAGVEFASEYPLTWKFRTTRGPSMGKAASPYSPLHFGQVMLGIGKSDLNDIKDPSNNTALELDKNGEWTDKTKEQVAKSRVKAKIQNLLNGQRLQSTSDWRFEYALDQLLAMLELQNIGAKAQLYTKVAEAIPFFASCNAEVNCSLMPKGDGYKENEDGTMELVFSRVTGMDERDAFMYSNKYDNVQPILVGINDTHMRLAMSDDRITFIIPFHASGGAEAQYKSMMQALEERFDDKREDYSPYQSDRRLPEGKRSEGQNIAYDLRYRILNSKKTGDNADTGVLNESERAILEDNDILRNLYERFFGKTIDGKEIKEKDQECYLVTIPGDQARLIFPYEYWDKTSTIETADVNGSRFISYCNTLGIIPRFSGVNSNGAYKAEKDFTNEKGYWKTLIDRRMYNNDGTYHIQKPVDVTNMDASYIDPKTPRPEIHTPSRSNDPTKEAEVVEKSIKEIKEAQAREVVTEAVLSSIKNSGIKVMKASAKQVKQMLSKITSAEKHMVYHGSSAKFDKFDHSYMGTGEGAQAYGWGSYVTEVEGIGRSYAKTAVRHNGNKIYINGENVTKMVPKSPLYAKTPTLFAASVVSNFGDSAMDYMQNTLKDLRNGISNLSKELTPKQWQSYNDTIELIEKAIDVYNNNDINVKKAIPTLYTVEIPDDNGSNYLAWDERYYEGRLNDLLDRVYDAVKDNKRFDFDAFKDELSLIEQYKEPVTGKIVYELLQSNIDDYDSKDTQRKTSEILSKAGFVGVSVPTNYRTRGDADATRNYVVFNEDDLQIKNSIELMQTPNGTVYGWTVGGKIYLTEDGFNPESPVHEYTHIWANAMRQHNPTGWASIKNLLKGTPVWNEVMSDDNYKNIRNNEDSVASEVLSRISGKENAEKMEKEALKMINEAKDSIGKARVQELIKRMKEALNKFWNWVGTELFKIEKFDSVEEVTDRVLYDLFNNTDLENVEKRGPVEFSIIPDGELKDKLQQEIDNGEYITLYRAARKINGKYYSPKMSKLGGVGQEIVLGELEQSDERPDLAYPVKMKDGSTKYKVDLDGSDPANSGLKKRNTNGVDYNPYIHASDSMMNDQFTAAFDMPEMVVLEVRVPKSELTSGYKADKAAESVGQKPWKSGSVDGKLPKNEQRKVYLSRYDMPVREVSTDEIADHIAAKLLRNNLSMPYNLVTPQVAEALLKRGVDVSEIPSGKVPEGQNERFAELKARVLRENNLTNNNAESSGTADVANGNNSEANKIAAIMAKNNNTTENTSSQNQIEEDGYSTSQQPGYSTNNLEMSWWDKQVFKLQDRMRPVKLIMDEILKKGGVIDETSDPHSQEVLSTSRADAEIQQFKNEKFEPMSKAIADGMKVLIEKMNMTAKDARDAINDLLYARHALERNKHICVGEIEQRMMDGIKVALRVLVDRKTNADLANRYATIGGTLQLANIPYGAVESARQNAGNIYNETLMDSNMMDAIHELAISAYDAQFNGTNTKVNTNNLTSQQKELFNILENVAHNKAKAISKDTVIDMKTGKKVVVANNRSGMSDAEARKIISDYYTAETKGVMDEISARVKDATNFTLDKWLEYGLISKEEYDKYKTQYEYYIPLRGWEDKEDIDYTELPSKQFNMASELINLNTHAEGRWSRAENPLAYIASLAMSACITGNRNLIRQHAFNMIDKNAHKIANLAVIENTYELYNDAGKLIGLTRKAPSKAMFDKGLVKVRKDLSYHWNKTSSQLGAHRVPVMIDGVRHVMYFKGKLGAQAAIAINGTGNDTRNVVLQQMAKWTRAMSSLMTGKNIYFLTKNTIRDLMFGNFAYFVENGYGKGLKLNKNFGIAFKTAFKDALGDTSDPLYQEFKRNGGQTGYVQLESIDKLGKEMEKMIKEAGEDKNKAVMSVRKAATIMEAIGKASENAMRFAVYKLERESGSSEREAAIRAKEITVNFNRQGKNTKGFSAVYAFFNPAIQGTFRFFKLAAEHRKRFTAAMGTMFALKMMSAWACQAFSDSGDDDEPTAYDNLSDYVKATNYCIPLGAFNDDWKDKFLCIPIAQSVRAPLSIADGLLDAMTGKKDFNEVMWEYMLFNIGEFAPFDIDAIDLTGDEPVSSAVQAFTPTPVRPIVEAYVLNRDFMGNPVHKEPYLRDDDITPQHQLAFNSTTPFLVGTSKMLNKLAGGDEKRSAGVQISQNGHIERSGLNIFDINPASVEHVLSGYFGGPAKVFIDLYNVGYGAVSEDVEINNDSYPIINQILKEPTSKPGYKDFYNMIEDGKLIEDTYGKYTPDEKPEIYKNPYNQKILELSKSAGDFVRNKNREIQATTDKEKKEALVNERDKRVREAAKEYKEIKEKYGK